MTDAPRAFLPAGALTGERINRALFEPLDAWSRACFPATQAEVSWEESGSPPAFNGAIVAVGERTSLLVSGPGKRRLLELALGKTLEGITLSEGDRRLLDAFATRIAENLVARLDGALGPDAGPVISLILALGGHAIGCLELKRQAIITLVRQSLLPTSTASRTPFLQSRMQTVTGLPIVVEGVLGRLQLTVEDANGLAVGDVLVLDRALEETAELRVEVSGALAAVGQLRPDQGCNTIIIVKSGKELN